ncbi:MAG: HD domain-containing protein [Candidatus Bathyarchaeota archaeon]|nr:MAG: HD domain-containing protein [Candidatus Bathyarchaeota archaeon]
MKRWVIVDGGTILDSRLKKIVDKIRDESLREKVAQLVENPTIEIEGEVYAGLSLEASPAGMSRHHSYPGGLIEHVVAMSEVASTLCDVIDRVYHGKVNRDLVLSGVILHDIFKPLIYEVEKNGTYGATPLAERLDHLTLIVSEMVRRDFPLNLIHIICAHHGGDAGPMWPRTVEALVCHLADATDARLNGEVLRAARYLSRGAAGVELDRLTSKEAFEIVHSKVVEGWDGVKKTVEKIRQSRLGAC